MVYIFALSIFLFPIMTTLGGDDWWNDMEFIFNVLSDPHYPPTQPTITSEAQVAEPIPDASQHSPLPNQMNEKQLRRRELVKRKLYEKTVTLSATEVEIFKQTIITDESYPQNIPLTEIEDKLLALGRLHEWFDIDTYDFTIYGKYWAKVCVSFWNKPPVQQQRYACVIYPSYGINTKRRLIIRDTIQCFDLLCCRCHMYEKNYKNNATAPETFLIHKYSENEFFVFDQDETKEKRFSLSIRDFKGGITLPKPLDEEQSKCRLLRPRLVGKWVTLSLEDIDIFNHALTFNKSYSDNISTIEIEKKLLQYEGVYEWPNLHKYDVENYSKYWGKVCVLFWGKQLDSGHRQACLVSPSYESNSQRKLFLSDRILHFDVLCCKCHSYIKNFKKPLSAPETFLIHQNSINEYFVFEQCATEKCNYTLIIKDFKEGIILPDPDAFNI